LVFWVANHLLALSGRQVRFRWYYVLLDLLLALWATFLIGFLGFSVVAAGSILLAFYTLVISITDFSTLTIPDALTYSYVMLGILLATFDTRISLIESVAGGLVGLALFWVIATIGWKVFKRQALGGGDIKLAAMLGVFLEPVSLLVALFFASVLALVYAAVLRLAISDRMTREIPFGPFVALAGTAFYSLSHGTAEYLHQVLLL
jgi:leader peptidase (prepilin peptidase) / N-methyltransferase